MTLTGNWRTSHLCSPLEVLCSPSTSPPWATPQMILRWRLSFVEDIDSWYLFAVLLTNANCASTLQSQLQAMCETLDSKIRRLSLKRGGEGFQIVLSWCYQSGSRYQIRWIFGGKNPNSLRHHFQKIVLQLFFEKRPIKAAYKGSKSAI